MTSDEQPNCECGVEISFERSTLDLELLLVVVAYHRLAVKLPNFLGANNNHMIQRPMQHSKITLQL